MTRQNLRFSAFLSFLNSLSTLIYLSWYRLGFQSDLERYLSLALSFVMLILFVKILFALRNLLHSRFSFRDADRMISLLVLMSVAVFVLHRLSLLRWEVKFPFWGLTQFAMIVSGFLFVMTAVRILRLRDYLGGYLRPYCHLLVARGIALLSFFLIPIGFLLGGFADVLLGLAFLRASEDSLV